MVDDRHMEPTKGERRERRRRNARKHVVTNRGVFLLAALTGIPSRRIIMRRKRGRK